MKTIKQYIEKYWLDIENSVRTRLYDKGTYFDGSKIKTYSATSGVYSDFTQNIKNEKGQPTDRVTLKDTGELYESFDVLFRKYTFLIEYDDEKENGNVSDNIPDIEEAIMLGEKGIEELKNKMVPDIRQDYLTAMRNAIYENL